MLSLFSPAPGCVMGGWAGEDSEGQQSTWSSVTESWFSRCLGLNSPPVRRVLRQLLGHRAIVRSHKQAVQGSVWNEPPEDSSWTAVMIVVALL